MSTRSPVPVDAEQFEARLGEAAAGGAGSFELALARWTFSRTSDADVAFAALAVAAAEQSGHGCASLSGDGDVRGFPWLPAPSLKRLRQHPWVGDGEHATPLVLDGHGRCYSHRSHAAERDIAAAVAARCSPPTAEPAWLGEDVAVLFAGQDAAASADQREAVRMAASTRLFVLSGGPGTGKTSTVVRWLSLLLRRRTELGLGTRPLIRLAAPTGKAAQRLADSVHDGAAALRASLAGDVAWIDALAELPRQATTLHRLLGFDPRRGRFRHDATQPLPADVVVVDEASMIDLGMMRSLLAALRPDARLLLIGDPDQLASVAAGSVLGDIVAAAETRATPLQPGLFDDVPIDRRGDAAAGAAIPLARQALRLRHVWRARGPLVAFADALRRGDVAAMQQLLSAEHDADEFVRLHPVDRTETLRRRLRAWLDSPWQADLQEQLRAPDADPLRALDALRGSQLLAALRDGPFGVTGINSFVAGWLRHRHGVPATAEWYAGRCVMVTRNDAALGLFNGDIGITLQDHDDLAVWFEARDDDGQRRARALSTRLLPEHTDAYALTIHKSQGSEYDRVAVVLPPDPDSPILSRELLYTGITRARRQAEIWGSEAALAAAATRPILRYGGLRDRLLRR